MPKCPKCKKEIEKLIHIRSGSISQPCSILNDEDDFLDYGNYDFTDDNNVIEYNCPLCDKTLFTNEKEAIKFLKGGNK